VSQPQSPQWPGVALPRLRPANATRDPYSAATHTRPPTTKGWAPSQTISSKLLRMLRSPPRWVAPASSAGRSGERSSFLDCVPRRVLMYRAATIHPFAAKASTRVCAHRLCSAPLLTDYIQMASSILHAHRSTSMLKDGIGYSAL
jgi:hypothetical protein